MGQDIVVINVVVVGVALAYVRVSRFISVVVLDDDAVDVKVSCFIGVVVLDVDAVDARGFLQYQCRDG